MKNKSFNEIIDHKYIVLKKNIKFLYSRKFIIYIMFF